jgi:outer membrane biosynthesis protein TonB
MHLRTNSARRYAYRFDFKRFAAIVVSHTDQHREAQMAKKCLKGKSEADAGTAEYRCKKCGALTTEKNHLCEPEKVSEGLEAAEEKEKTKKKDKSKKKEKSEKKEKKKSKKDKAEKEEKPKKDKSEKKKDKDKKKKKDKKKEKSKKKNKKK